MIIHSCIIIAVIILFLIYFFNYNTLEFFDESSASDIESGATTYYDWNQQLSNNTKSHNKKLYNKYKCPKCDYIFINEYEKKYDRYCESPMKNNCKNCDITRHPDIHKYVLKSSIPPTPDLSKYATKSMIQACPDMSDYIHKSQIPTQNVNVNTSEGQYLTKEQCEKYKRSLFTDIEDWIKSFFGDGSEKQKGMLSHSFGDNTGYSTQNTGYGLNGGDIKKTPSDAITISPGKATPEKQQAVQQSYQNELAGWSNSKLGSGVFLGLPNV